MTHLNADDLARLVDEAMATHEVAHLSRCAACLAALEEMRLQRRALRALPAMAPPPAAWSRIEQRLAASPSMKVRQLWMPRRRERFAAAVLWMLIGAGIQALLVALMFSGGGAGGNSVPSRLGIGPPIKGGAVAIEKEFRDAEDQYRKALTQYATVSGSGPVSDPTARLATLDAIIATTGAALRKAPADPLINGFHLAALSERDALLRQLSIKGSGGELRWY
jgi:hypothetical protein